MKSLTVPFAWLCAIVAHGISFGMNSEDVFLLHFWQQKIYLTMWQSLYSLATLHLLLLGIFITKSKGQQRNYRNTDQDLSPKCPISPVLCEEFGSVSATRAVLSN